MSRVWPAALALAVLLMAPRVEAQATSVVIATLDGRNSAAARRAMQAGLEERGLTVTLGESDPGDDASATAALAAGASAQAVIGGRASARGAREWRVNLWIRDAQGGAQGEVRMRVSGRRGVNRLVGRLAEALELVPTASSPSAPPAAGDAPDRGDGGGDEGDDDRDDDEGDDAAGDEAPRRPASASAPDDPSAPPPLISTWAMIGAGVASRYVELLSPDGVDAGYRAEPFFEINARVGARFFDVLFARARFGSSVALDSRREAASLGNVDTWFFHLRGDVGASVWIDDTVEVGAAFGVGWDRYELAFNELVPTAEYVHLRPALVTGFRLIEQLVVLDAEVGLRFPLGVGDLQSLHGVDYSVLGVDGLLRLHGLVDPGFIWAIEGGFRHYGLTFNRPGGDVTGHDAGWHATGYVGWQLDISG